MPVLDFTQKEETKPPVTAVVPAAPDRTLAAPKYTSTDDFEGEITARDQIMPRIVIVAKSSKLVDAGFTPGEFVINKSLGLGKGPLIISAIKAIKKYREATDPDGDGEMGGIFNTTAEVEAAGLHVSDNPCSKEYNKEAAPFADLLLWVERPAASKDETEFTVPLPSGRVGAICIFSAARTNFNVFKQMVGLKARKARLQTFGLPLQGWEIKSILNDTPSFSWFSASLRPGAELSEEDAAFLKSFAGG